MSWSAKNFGHLAQRAQRARTHATAIASACDFFGCSLASETLVARRQSFRAVTPILPDSFATERSHSRPNGSSTEMMSDRQGYSPKPEQGAAA